MFYYKRQKKFKNNNFAKIEINLMIKEKIDTDQLIKYAIEGIQEVKGQEITLLDMRGLDSAVCDYFVICTGTSNTHVNAIVNSVRKVVSKAIHDKPWHTEGADNGEWVLMDYVNVVVHVFQKRIREYYDIESLWGDAKITAIEDD